MAPDYHCYFNGEMIRYADCKLHVSDLLIQRGYGVFDFFRSRQGDIHWLDDYTDRLFKSIKLSEFDISPEKEDFQAMVSNLQVKNKLHNGAFKVIVTGGESENLAEVSGSPDFIILNVPWKRPPLETFQNGVPLISYDYVRPNPEIKTLNYFNTLRLRKKMKEYGAVDVLFHNDRVSEASRANLFFVKNGSVTTPGDNILMGITRKQVMSIFREVRVVEIDAGSIFDFDEIFMASTTRDITPVVAVDGKKIGRGKPGPFTKEVQASFRERGYME
ncbi:MAG: aminotransferase class IV [Bacteroidales bacterium]|nr:aminotransferase class IV [Bacteroidales bacterium]